MHAVVAMHDGVAVMRHLCGAGAWSMTALPCSWARLPRVSLALGMDVGRFRAVCQITWYRSVGTKSIFKEAANERAHTNRKLAGLGN